MLRDLFDNIGGKSVLLLQGPGGPFFRRFARDLEGRGARVTKVNFSPGDALFYRRGAIPFKHRMSEWPAFFRELVAREATEIVFLFGDRRRHHRDAIAACEELGIDVYVFEEGYLRPHWITCEKGGVNGHSHLPRDPDFYRRAVADLPELEPVVEVGQTFWWSALYATLHAVAVTLFGWRYPHYRHHRNVNCFYQAFAWGRGALRKLWYRLRERHISERVTGDWDGRYYFVPLQVHCDAQLQHSPFASIDAMIEEVVATFAATAPAGTRLVLKHHPHDRAYRDYGRLMSRLAAEHGLEDRLVYVHDVHLPTLLRHARGTVTMNSTVGISSLHHKTPVKVLGTAVYDIPGLTYQDALAAFFRDPGDVDGELYAAFSRYLREANQINGSFNKRLPGVDTASGARLPQHASACDEPPTIADPRGRESIV